MNLFLKRVLFTDDGVLGVLFDGRKFICWTLEEEWKDNAKGLSCIPEGTYAIQRVDTPHHGVTYQILDVPHRTGILFHSGNTEIDTLGCVLTGTEPGVMWAMDDDSRENETQLAIFNSKVAFNLFMEHMNNRERASLTIKNC